MPKLIFTEGVCRPKLVHFYSSTSFFTPWTVLRSLMKVVHYNANRSLSHRCAYNSLRVRAEVANLVLIAN